MTRRASLGSKASKGKATLAKVRNKQQNKAKRTSYRQEKEIRKAQQIKERNSKTVQVSIGGEMVPIDASSRKGKKLVARLKRKAKEEKQKLPKETFPPKLSRQSQPGSQQTHVRSKVKATGDMEDDDHRGSHSSDAGSDGGSDDGSDDDDDDDDNHSDEISDDDVNADGDDDNEDDVDDDDDDIDDVTDASLDDDEDDLSDISSDIDDEEEPVSPEEDDLMKSLDPIAQKLRKQKKDLPGHLFLNLPRLDPLPAKLIATMKQRGRNPKTVQQERELKHEVKLRKLLTERENQWREQDSDLDDSDNADYEADPEMDEALLKYLGGVDAEALAKAKPLEKLKQDKKDQQRNQLADLQKAVKQKIKVPQIPPTDATSSTIPDDEEIQTRKQRLQQRQTKPVQHTDRMMVLLDDGTWGYRDDQALAGPSAPLVDSPSTETESAIASEQQPAPQVDLSAYVRQPKTKKKKQNELDAMNDDAVDEKPSAALTNYKTFVGTAYEEAPTSVHAENTRNHHAVSMAAASRQVEQYYKARLNRIRDAQLLIGQLSTEILENPEKTIMLGHMESLLDLCRDNDNTIRQLALVSCATVFGDIIPSYRFRVDKKQTTGPEPKLTKQVKAARDYESTFLRFYKQLCTILHRNVMRGLKVYHKSQGIEDNDDDGQDQMDDAYDVTDLDLREKQNTLYLVSLKSISRLFTKAYHFNFNTQLASLLASVLTSDHTEWADIASASVVEVFKLDKCGESTIEIVQCIGNLCKKRAGERIRAPLLRVLLDLPLSYRVIHYEDPNKERKEQEEKRMRKLNKKDGKIKGKLGAGHHYFMQQMENTQKGVQQMKKAMRSGKDFDVHQSSIVQKEKAHKAMVKSVERSMRESNAVITMDERQKNQTKVLSIVFTIFFRYLKQAPTIKTLYNLNMQNQQQDMTAPVLEANLPPGQQATAPAAESGKVLTQTMLGVVSPPSHRVFSVVLRGVMKYAQLINLELVLDLLQHLLKVVETTTETHSLPLASSLMCIETTFTLLQMHCSAIEIDLAPHYQVFHQVIWQLLYEPHQTPLVIKCLDLSILQRKHIPPRRIAAICRRLFQVAMHLPAQFSLPLTQIISQCTVAHPTIGAYYDNDRLQSGQYMHDAPNPDTSDAISWPAWEATSFGLLYHPYAPTINTHTILSDIRLGTTQNSDGKAVNNGVDRSKLSVSLTSIVPDDNGVLRRQTRVIPVSRLKALDLLMALDVSKGGFCPDVLAPDAKKQRKLIHNNFYMNYAAFADQGLQSVALTDILDGASIQQFVASPVLEAEDFDF